MNRFFVETKVDNEFHISKQDSVHLSKVLRLKPMDKVEVVYENRLYKGEIVSSGVIKEIEEIPVNSEPIREVTLFQGYPKAGKLELIIQKCTEIGIKSIVPLIVNRCVVKVKEEKTQRFNKIAQEACKQCKRIAVPAVFDSVKIKDIALCDFDLSLVFYEGEKARSLKNALMENPDAKKIAIIIGPEGGFETEEIQALTEKGAISVSLGKRILRTETAPISALSAVLYHYGDMEV